MMARECARSERITIGELPFGYDEDLLRQFCAEIFDSLPRVDQRRAADAYVGGLLRLRCDERKTIRRIAATIPSHTSQSLQQFVSQSRWDAQPVRRLMATSLVEDMPVDLWVIDDVVFPKNGCHSAAVGRQWVPALGRMVNCQLGVPVMMTNDDVSVPVNWRLYLPESWDVDEQRRSRARIPAGERHRPYWQYLLELVDDMTVDWGIPVAPIVSDLRHRTGIEDYLTELERRGLCYLVQVDGREQVRAVGDHLARGRAGSLAPDPRTPALSDLVRASGQVERQTCVWREGPAQRTLRSQFLTLLVEQPASAAGRPAEKWQGPRQVLVEWPLGKDRPRACWLTNLTDWSMPELVAAVKLRWRAQHGIADLTKYFGLHDYEGRSFRGWHHHLTLASAAYLFHLRSHLPDDGASTAVAAAGG